MGMPAARVMDPTSHGPPLMPGPGSANVFIGGKPAWRALPAAMGMALQAAQAVADAIVKTAEAATIASDPLTKAGFLAAESAAKVAATTALTAMMNGMGGAATALTLGAGSPDKHMCSIPTAPSPAPHGMGMVIDGSGCVLTNGLPQSAQGDKVLEALGGPDPIAMGQFNVLVGKCGGGGGMFSALADLVNQLIDSAMKAANAVAAFAKDAVAFVKGLVNSVIAGILAKARQLTQAVVDAVVGALKDLSKAVAEALRRAKEEYAAYQERKKAKAKEAADKKKRQEGGKKIYPGQQKYGNCGIQSSGQLIEAQTGKRPDEKAALDDAIAKGNASDNPVDSEKGGTSAAQRQKILKDGGVDSKIVPTTPDALGEAIRDNKVVVANVDAGELWNDPAYSGGGHAITVYDGDFDENGNLTHVYINDTGAGKQGRKMTIDEFMKAANAKKGGSSLNVPDKPSF